MVILVAGSCILFFDSAFSTKSWPWIQNRSFFLKVETSKNHITSSNSQAQLVEKNFFEEGKHSENFIRNDMFPEERQGLKLEHGTR